VFFDLLLLEILYYEVRIVIFQIVKDYGRKNWSLPQFVRVDFSWRLQSLQQEKRIDPWGDCGGGPSNFDEWRAVYSCRRRWRWCTVTIKWCHFPWLWTNPNPVFKATALFDAKYITNGYRYGHMYYRRWIGNRTQAFEWHQFQSHWVTSKPDFKVMVLFNVK